MAYFQCRLACYDGNLHGAFSGTLDNWSYRELLVTDVQVSMNSMAKSFHPLMMRLAASFLPALEGNQFPEIIVDFGQWVEKIKLKCFYKAEDSLDAADFYTGLRKWIRVNQGIAIRKMFLQLMVRDEKCHMDPGDTPLGMVPGWGFRGMVTGLSAQLNAERLQNVDYSLDFTCGLVVGV